MKPPMDTFNPTSASAPPERLAIRFTGDGGGYFRIWIVNVLLTLVTLSLYLPFAKARRLQWFYAHTEVGGHALAFHGDPWRMLRGHLLLLVAFVVYAVGGQVSPALSGVAGMVLLALWPALWRSGMRFRLANTSWRGVRLAFLGGVGGAYGVFAPMLLIAVGVGVAAAVLVPMVSGGGWYLALIGVVLMVIAVYAPMPWVLARLKRYQHDNYAWANQRTRLTVGVGAWYVLVLKTLGLALLIGVVGSAALGGLGFAALDKEMAGGLVVVAMVGLYLAMLLIPAPYFLTRMQNLLWGHTASEQLRFESTLRVAPMLKVNAINWFLTVLTLGLYRPFAVVAMARLRLEAVSVQVSGDVSQWPVTYGGEAGNTAGEAAGDFFGFDVGL